MGPEMEGSEEWQEVWPEPRAGALLEVLARRLNLSPRAVRSPEKDLVGVGPLCKPVSLNVRGRLGRQTLVELSVTGEHSAHRRLAVDSDTRQGQNSAPRAEGGGTWGQATLERLLCAGPRLRTVVCK